MTEVGAVKDVNSNKIKLQSTSNHHNNIRLLYKAKSGQTQQSIVTKTAEFSVW